MRGQITDADADARQVSWALTLHPEAKDTGSALPPVRRVGTVLPTCHSLPQPAWAPPTVPQCPGTHPRPPAVWEKQRQAPRGLGRCYLPRVGTVKCKENPALAPTDRAELQRLTDPWQRTWPQPQMVGHGRSAQCGQRPSPSPHFLLGGSENSNCNMNSHDCRSPENHPFHRLQRHQRCGLRRCLG